jgi:hypothetical protein
VIGGALLVGAVYWFVYLRPSRAIDDQDRRSRFHSSPGARTS